MDRPEPKSFDERGVMIDQNEPNQQIDSADAGAVLNSQNAPKRYNAAGEITDEQRRAVLMMLGGSSDSAVACELGVHRTTVTRWRLGCASFREALQNGRKELWSTELDQVRALIHEGLEELRRQIKRGMPMERWRAAKLVLPLVGSPKLAPRLAKDDREEEETVERDRD
jgi:hypothetical protein